MSQQTAPRTTTRAALAGLGAIGLGVSLALGAPTTQVAHADTTTPAGCTAAGQVWLMVVTEDGKQLANQCVGTPKTGIEALETAKVAIVRDSKNMLCTLGGHPAACPTKFNGQFWNYYQSDAAGKWTFATKGPDQSAPKPGTVEGWCYNKATEQSCAMPKLELTAAGGSTPAASGTESAGSTASANSSVTPTETATASEQASTNTTEKKSSGPWVVVATIAALALAAGGYLLWRRNQQAR